MHCWPAAFPPGMRNWPQFRRDMTHSTATPATCAGRLYKTGQGWPGTTRRVNQHWPLSTFAPASKSANDRRLNPSTTAAPATAAVATATKPGPPVPRSAAVQQTRSRARRSPFQALFSPVRGQPKRLHERTGFRCAAFHGLVGTPWLLESVRVSTPGREG